jgi:hypothetical protein
MMIGVRGTSAHKHTRSARNQKVKEDGEVEGGGQQRGHTAPIGGRGESP